MPTCGDNAFATSAAPAFPVVCTAVVVLAAPAAAWPAASAAVAASAALLKEARSSVCAPPAAVAPSASAAAFAAADGSATVVAAVVDVVLPAPDPLPLPNKPAAKVLPSADSVSPLLAPAPKLPAGVAFAAAPLASACAGTTAWPLASAASAACRASCADLESVAEVFLPVAPSVVGSVPACVVAASVSAAAGSVLAGSAALFALACACACACAAAAAAAVPASVCVVVLVDFEGVALFVPFEACCEPDDEADDELDADPFAELPLLVLLLAAFWFCVDGSDGGGASCTLDEEAEEDEEAEDDEEADEEDEEDGGAGGLLALCTAVLFCRLMLCCRVCENGVAFAAAAMAAVVDVLLAEPSSEPICERSDIGNPVNPSNGVFGQRGGARARQTPSARILRMRAACSSASR